MTNPTKVTPRGKHILVRVEEEGSRENQFGLITPTNVEQERKSIGLVTAVGPDISGLSIGRRVIFGTYAGDDLKLTEPTLSGGDMEVDYKILHDDDVLAIIEE